MKKRNPENERLKRAFFSYLRNAGQKDTTTIDKVAGAILRYEDATNFKAFKKFHLEDVTKYKRHLENAKSTRSGQALAKSTIDAELRMFKAFYIFAAGQQGYKSKLDYRHAAYFNNNAKDARVAHAKREIRFPSMEQCAHAFANLPSAKLIDKRNRAIFALLMLTGIRDGALASLRLKHVDLIEGQIFQDAREVRTKNSKTFYTWFFPVGQEYLDCFTEWVTLLRKEMLCSPDEALFPKPKIEVVKDQGFQATGLTTEIYANAQFVRSIVKNAFINAGLFPFIPHSFRKTLVKFGDEICTTREEFKAWSMNLGHDSIDTTISSYLPISVDRQGELIKGLRCS